MEINVQERQQLEAMVQQGMAEGWLEQEPERILIDIQDDLAEMYIAAGVVMAGEAVDWDTQVREFLQERRQQLAKILCDPKTASLRASWRTFLGREDFPSLLNNLVIDLLPIVMFNQEIEVAKYLPLAIKLAFYVVRVGLDKWCAGMSRPAQA